MDQNSTKNGHGALVGSIVIIIILILGAFYFIGQTKDVKNANDVGNTVGTDTTNSEEVFIESQSSQSSSDDLSSIEADLEATNIDMLDEGL